MCASASVQFVQNKYPDSLGTTQLQRGMMKTFYEKGNISFWQAHLCGIPSTEVLDKKIYGCISYMEFLTSCFYHPRDSLQWDLSLLQDKSWLFSVEKDFRDHIAQPPHIMDKEYENQVIQLQGYTTT